MTDSAADAGAIVTIMHDVAQQTFPAATLYVVATPIGNTGDISLRALHLLTIADAVACEDTRNTGHLLSRYGLSKPLIAAHQHNEREVAERLIVRLQQSERIALVSDAGTPAVSDPGARIVDTIRAAGLCVVPLPGACAVIAALSASGLLNDGFHFIGFLPTKAGQRETMLAGLTSVRGTLMFYEAPHRIQETTAALAAAFSPERQIVFARELTKLFEEIHRCALADACDWLVQNATRRKGEFVILLEGAATDTDGHQAESDRILSILLEECPVKQAATLAARITGQKKNALYDRALKLNAAGNELSRLA